jgi:hypothetical protein
MEGRLSGRVYISIKGEEFRVNDDICCMDDHQSH